MIPSADGSIINPMNILLPLRKSVIPYDQLKHVMIVAANADELRKEWKCLSMYPKVIPVLVSTLLVKSVIGPFIFHKLSLWNAVVDKSLRANVSSS